MIMNVFRLESAFKTITDKLHVNNLVQMWWVVRWQKLIDKGGNSKILWEQGNIWILCYWHLSVHMFIYSALPRFQMCTYKIATPQTHINAQSSMHDGCTFRINIKPRNSVFVCEINSIHEVTNKQTNSIRMKYQMYFVTLTGNFVYYFNLQHTIYILFLSRMFCTYCTIQH